MFANDGFKIRGWDETGLHVGSACRFGSSIGTLVTADADVAWFGLLGFNASATARVISRW